MTKPIDPLKIISIKQDLKNIKLLDNSINTWDLVDKIRLFRDLFEVREISYDEWRKSNSSLPLLKILNK